MINIVGFDIEDAGDASVGLFGAKYEIRGGFNFEDANELNEFTEALSSTFELIMADKPIINSVFE